MSRSVQSSMSVSSSSYATPSLAGGETFLGPSSTSSVASRSANTSFSTGSHSTAPTTASSLETLVTQQRRCIKMLKAKLRHLQKQQQPQKQAPSAVALVLPGDASSAAAAAAPCTGIGRDESDASGKRHHREDWKEGVLAKSIRDVDLTSTTSKYGGQEQAEDVDDNSSAWSFEDTCGTSTATTATIAGSSVVREIKKTASETELLLVSQRLDERSREAERLGRELADSSARADRLRADLRAKEKELGNVKLERDLIAADEGRLRDEVARLKREMAAERRGRGKDSSSSGTNAADTTTEDVSVRSTTEKQPMVEQPGGVQKGSSKSASVLPTTFEGSGEANGPAGQPNAADTRRDSLSLSDTQARTSESTVRERTLDNNTQSLCAANKRTTLSWDTSQSAASSINSPRRIETGQMTSEVSVRAQRDHPVRSETMEDCSTQSGDNPFTVVSPTSGLAKGFRYRRRSSMNSDKAKRRSSRPSGRNSSPLECESTKPQCVCKRIGGAEGNADEDRSSQMEPSGRYHDGFVQSLQRRVALLKEEKLGVELELVNQLALLDHEKHALAKDLQEQMRRKDAKIALQEAEITRLLGRIQVGVMEERQTFASGDLVSF